MKNASAAQLLASSFGLSASWRREGSIHLDRFLEKTLRSRCRKHPIFCASSIRRSLSRTLRGGGSTWGTKGDRKKKSAFFGDQHSFGPGQGHTNLAWGRPRKKQYNKMLPNFYGAFPIRPRFSFLQPFRRAITLAKNSYVFDNLMRKSCWRIILYTTWRFRRYCSQEEVFGQSAWEWLGDWPWLTKCGNLQRSYSNVSKHADSGGGNRRACGRYLSFMPRRPTRCSIRGNKYAKSWLEADGISGGWQSPRLWRYLSFMPRRPTRCSIRGNKIRENPGWKQTVSWNKTPFCRRDPFRVRAAPTERIAVVFSISIYFMFGT